MIEKLKNQGRTDYYQLSLLIQKQIEYSQSQVMDPREVWKYKETPSQDYSKLELITLKNNGHSMREIIDQTCGPDDMFLYNVFRT